MKKYFVIVLLLVIFIFLLFLPKKKVKIKNGNITVVYLNNIKIIFKTNKNYTTIIYNYSKFNLTKKVNKRISFLPCFNTSGGFSVFSGSILFKKTNLSNNCLKIIKNLFKINKTPNNCVEYYIKNQYIEVQCNNITIRMYFSNN